MERVTNVNLLTPETLKQAAHKEYILVRGNNQDTIFKVSQHLTAQGEVLTAARNSVTGAWFGWCADLQDLKNHINK